MGHVPVRFRVETASATAAIVLIVVTAVAFIAGQLQLADITGPDELAAGGGRVAVHASGRIWVLDGQGRLLAVKEAGELGLAGSVAELRFLSDGDLLAAGFGPMQAVRCRLPAWRCHRVELGLYGSGTKQFSLLPDAKRGGWWLLETWSGRLWRLPADGSRGTTVPLRDAASGPNDLALDDSGRLWVADTRGHRLLAVDPDTGERAAQWRLREVAGVESLYWPMSLARDGAGRWWVVHWDGLGHQGGLWVHDPARKESQPVSLDDSALPVEVAALDGHVLIVSDQGGFRLWTVDAGSLRATEFGDGAFRHAMAELRDRREFWGELSFLTLAVALPLALVMAVVAYVATPKEKRFSGGVMQGIEPPLAADARAVPRVGDLHWLRRDPRGERFLRWVLPLAAGIVVAMVVLSWVMYDWMLATMGGIPAAGGDGGMPEKAPALLHLFTLLNAGILVVAWLSVAPMRRRLGTDGRRIHVALPGGTRVSADASQVAYDRTHLLVEGVAVATRLGNGMRLYAEGEIETHLAPLLARARRVGTLTMLGRRLAAGDKAVLAQLVFIAGVLVALAATGAWQDMLARVPGLGQ